MSKKLAALVIVIAIIMLVIGLYQERPPSSLFPLVVIMILSSCILAWGESHE